MIAADRGLCGGYNAGVQRAADISAIDAEALGEAQSAKTLATE